MSTTEEKINLLEEFIERDKFSTKAWNDRGLNPSDDWLCESLKKGFNSTAGSLIDDLKGSTKTHLKSILVQSLSDCKKLNLDREEKEFVADLFAELSQIVDINMKSNLDTFLYGYTLVLFQKAIRFLKPEKIIAEYKKNCSKCNNEFRIQLLDSTQTTSSLSWVIGRCSKCGEFNLYEEKAKAKRVQFQGFFPEEYLPKDDYSFAKAQSRLEQVKYFRK